MTIDTKQPALTPEAFVARWRKIIALLRFGSGMMTPDIEEDVKGMLDDMGARHGEREGRLLAEIERLQLVIRGKTFVTETAP